MKRPVAKISNHSRKLATFASDVIDHSRRLAKVVNLRIALLRIQSKRTLTCIFASNPDISNMTSNIRCAVIPEQFFYQRWSRGHKARGQGQGQGHKKNPRPRPRPRTAFPRTDTLEAKDRNARGQGQGPRTQSASALQKKKKKGLHKNFSGDLQKKKKKKKKGLHKNFSSDLH